MFPVLFSQKISSACKWGHDVFWKFWKIWYNLTKIESIRSEKRFLRKRRNFNDRHLCYSKAPIKNKIKSVDVNYLTSIYSTLILCCFRATRWRALNWIFAATGSWRRVLLKVYSFVYLWLLCITSALWKNTLNSNQDLKCFFHDTLFFVSSWALSFSSVQFSDASRIFEIPFVVCRGLQ